MEEEKKTEEKPKKKKSILRKTMKVILWFLVSVILLILLIFGLLSIPGVQQKVIDAAIAKISPLINTKVSIDKVHIGFFNRVDLEGVYVEDQTQDTLLYANKLNVRISVLTLLRNELHINSATLDNAIINVWQENPDSDFNFQFLIDAFTSNDTIQKENDNPMKIILNNIEIKNSRLNYDVRSELLTPDTFDVSHISVSAFNAKIDFDMINTYNFEVNVESFSLFEKSGLRVHNLEGKVESKDSRITSNKLRLELPETYLEINDLKFNMITKELSASVNSKIKKEDILPLVPQFTNLENILSLNGSVSGKLPLINVEGLSLNYGDELTLRANASIGDYRNYGNSNLKLIIENFRATPKAIADIARFGDPEYTNPEILAPVQYVAAKGTIEGLLSNMQINLDAWTNQGSVQLTGTAATDTSFDDIRSKVNLRTQNFNLAPFVGPETGLGRVTMYANIDLQITEDFSATIEGAINSIQHEGNTFGNIRFRGKYDPSIISGWINADLPVGKILADGSISQTNNPEIKLNASIHDLAIDYFYNNPYWKNPRLNAHIAANFKGADINTMQGMAIVDSLHLWGDNMNYEPGRIILESGISQDTGRYILLKSSILDARLTGEYNFITMADELTNFMSHYLPSFFDENPRLTTYRNNFTLDITVKNSEDLGKLLNLPVDVITPLNISSIINLPNNQLDIRGNFPFIRYGENDVKNLRLGINNSATALNIEANGYMVQDTGSLAIKLNAEIATDTIGALLTVNNNHSHYAIDGQVKAHAHFIHEGNELVSYLNILPTNVAFGSLNFAILPAEIINREERTTISNFGLSLNNRKYVGVEGTLSALPSDSVRLYFDRTQIGDILKAFDINNIKGEANGQIIVTKALDQPELYTNGLNLADIVIFGDSLGTLNVSSNWSDIQSAVNFDATLVNNISTSTVQGHYSTTNDSININANIDRLSVRWLQPFMSDILSRTEGSLSAQMRIAGNLETPMADGWLGFNNMYIGVDFTNVTYHISDTIRILPDKIGFRDLKVEDNNNGTATASALLSHENFKNFQFGMNLDLNNFMILNTGSRSDSLFYGRVMASGNVKAEGSDKNINVTMDVRNDKNSNLNITLPETSDAAVYQSIVYINVPEDSLRKTIIPEPELALPLNLNMKLAVNRDLQLGVIIDPVTGDQMQVNGSGTVQFSYDMQSEDMRAYGEYILSEGSVRLRLQDIKTLEFKIEEGSKLEFIGDPMRTTFDIKAYRRVRASLSTLDESFGTGRVNVDCILGIKGSIQNIEFTYDVTIPDASDDVQQKLRSLLFSDEEKLKQFVFLVLTNSFYSGDNVGGNFADSALAGLTSSALSTVTDALFGNILGDKWEIGTDISTSDGTFSDVDVNVNLSTRFFNDRLKFNTSLGYRTEQVSSTDSDGQFIGDFDLEYELTRLWKLHIYNRTNDRIYTQAKAPTTQGIGIVYTKEAKTLRGLFQSFRRRRTVQQTETTTATE